MSFMNCQLRIVGIGRLIACGSGILLQPEARMKFCCAASFVVIPDAIVGSRRTILFQGHSFANPSVPGAPQQPSIYEQRYDARRKFAGESKQLRDEPRNDR
jgi:hypothetical protein